MKMNEFPLLCPPSFAELMNRCGESDSAEFLGYASKSIPKLN